MKSTCRWCPRETARPSGICFTCERDGAGETNDSLGLDPGRWVSGRNGIQTYVYDPVVIRQCPQGDCTRVVGPKAAMCERCTTKQRRARARGEVA